MTIDERCKLPYTRLLRQDEEGDWIAGIKEWDGCMVHGSTIAEAMEFLEEAMYMWVEVSVDAGLDIPMPGPAWWDE